MQVPPLQVAPTAVRQTGGFVQMVVPPPHVPPAQVLPVVQTSPSSQLAPLFPGPVVQTLVWQVVCWQGLLGCVQASGPHRTVPPQPSLTVPQFAPPGQVVRGVQPHCVGSPPPPQVSGLVQTSQAAPPVPQATFSFPASHSNPAQQPVQKGVQSTG